MLREPRSGGHWSNFFVRCVCVYVYVYVYVCVCVCVVLCTRMCVPTRATRANLDISHEGCMHARTKVCELRYPSELFQSPW